MSLNTMRCGALLTLLVPFLSAFGQELLGTTSVLEAERLAPAAVAGPDTDSESASIDSQAVPGTSGGEPGAPPGQLDQNKLGTGAASRSAPAKEGFLRSLVNDEVWIWTSPFRPSSYSSHAMKKYGLPFLLISAAAIATDSQTADWLPNTRDQEIWSGRISQIGAAYTLAGFSGVTYLIGAARSDRHLKEASLLALQALAHAQAVTFVLKEATQRERPIEEKGRIGFWKGGDSFPSGHSTSSFAVATVFAYEYRHYIAVPITAYSLAAVVSASRMSARRHWVSDIFVGSSMGFMLGRFVYKRHHDPDLPGSRVEPRTGLVPDLDVGPRTVALSWRW